MEMPGLRTMKMMKKAMMEGKRGASEKRQYDALDMGAYCPHIPPRNGIVLPGNPASDGRKNSRKKRVGPTSHFVTVRLSQRAQPGPSHDDETVAGPYTPCSLSRVSQGSLTGSLIVPMATLIPRAHRTMARELTILADLSFLPFRHIETTRALGLLTPPPAPSRGRGNLAVASLRFRPSPGLSSSSFHVEKQTLIVPHQGHHGGRK